MEEPEIISNNSNNGMAAISYLGILVLIPLLTSAKTDPFVKFHVKQGIVLAVISFALLFIVVPILPLGAYFLASVINISILVFAIIGIVNAITGKKAELPLIGRWADMVKI